MLKPDALARGLAGEIIGRLERTGLRLVAARLLHATREMAEKQYGEDIARKHGPQIRQWLLDYICSGPVLPMVWEGDNAVITVRVVAGDRPSPCDCAPGTIRRDLSTDSAELATAQQRAIYNLIHTADSAAAAEREIAIWFPPEGGHRADQSHGGP